MDHAEMAAKPPPPIQQNNLMNTDAPVIAGIDFSAPALSVLRHSIQIAARSGAPMVALHVIDSGSLAHRAASGGTESGG